MNRTVKSCFAAGAAFAALTFAPVAHAQAPGPTTWSMSGPSVAPSVGGSFTITVSGNSQGSNVITAQCNMLYDSTFLTLDGTLTAAITVHPDALAGGNWGSATTRAEPTNALWPPPIKDAKILLGATTAAPYSGNLFVYHFKWTGPAGTTRIEFTNNRFPDTSGTLPVSGANRTRFANGVAPTVNATFSPGLRDLTTVPAPSAVLAFAAGLPMLGVALRRRK